jgi:cation diffusion facilitator family transporter
MVEPHSHVFLGRDHDRNALRTWLVIALTTAMMVAEIVAGTLFGSMALLADGWHMSTHAGALLISAAAYGYAKRHRDNPRFTYGTGKVGDLAAFTSAVVLALVALLIAWESLQRLIAPVPIDFTDAIVVAVIGLAVNLASAALLHQGGHGHDHHHHYDHDHHHVSHDGHAEPHEQPLHWVADHAHAGTHRHDSGHHGHDHGHGHHGHDTNLRAAYFHVLADALTSVLAIAALLAGMFLGWNWLDALSGLVGALVIAHWSRGLMQTAAATLLDMTPGDNLVRGARSKLESAGARVVDLHLWRLGPGHVGVTASVASSEPRTPDEYRRLLTDLPGVSHVTVEVNRDAA